MNETSPSRRWRLAALTILAVCLAVFLIVFFLVRAFAQPAEPMAPGEGPTTETTLAVDVPAEPPAELNDWRLLLVNPWNPVPEDYEVTLVDLQNDQQVDRRCYPDLQRMMDDCRTAGLDPLICSSYRTQETQQRLYDRRVERFEKEGLDRSEALVEAAMVVAYPGTSEHQLGLAMDIVDRTYQVLDQAQADTDVQQWLMEHSWEYGFVLRYPEGKTQVTGIIYEPWHYRYVGREAAKVMQEQHLCLEEYINYLKNIPNG